MKKELVNPYQAGNPIIDEEGFFGRLSMLNWIEESLCSPNTDSLVIFGQRRIGKTSLLFKLKRTLPGDLYCPVYFDLQDQATRPLGSVLGELADAIAYEMDLEESQISDFDDQGRFFERTFLPRVFEKLPGKSRLVILFDEFEILDQSDPRELAAGNAGVALHRFLRRFMGSDLRLVFIFSMGQRLEYLSQNAKTTLKSSPQREIGLLDPKSARSLVLKAQANKTLNFTKGGLNRVLSITNRHPFLTQLLCQTIWRKAHRGKQPPPETPTIDVGAVEDAIEEALETGDNSLAWMWDVVTPAEKIYLAALAEVAKEGEAVPVDRVIDVIVNHSPERRNREVEQASYSLVRRKIIEEKGEESHRFHIDLFRRWIHHRKDLRMVEDELSRLKPDAEAIFAAGEKVFLKKRWERASSLFWQALDINPHHLKARLLLGESLLYQGNTDKAVEELEKAYKLNPRIARLALARALIKKADGLQERDADEALRLCDRVLELSPRESQARDIQARISDSAADKKATALKKVGTDTRDS